MTKYHGGKQRIGAYIADAIKQVSEHYKSKYSISFKGYLEPFCGMLGVYQHIPPVLSVNKYIAGDINKSVILMWNKAIKGWKPPVHTTQDEFYRLKESNRSSALKGFIGHACSHRGIYFSPFCSKTDLLYSSNRVSQIANDLKNVQFQHCSYSNFIQLKNYIIYCDPPYFKSSRYYDEKGVPLKFNHVEFYKWAKHMSQNNLVFVSENSDLPYTLIGEWGDEKLYLIN